MYLQISANTALGKEIEKLTPWRNYCAHQAFLEEFMSKTDAERENQKDEAGVVAATQATLQVLQTLQAELLQIIPVHLNITKPQQKGTTE